MGGQARRGYALHDIETERVEDGARSDDEQAEDEVDLGTQRRTGGCQPSEGRKRGA